MEENNNINFNMGEKNNNKNTVLIVIIIVLALALLGLSYYTFFVKNNNKPAATSVEEDNNNEKIINDEKQDSIYMEYNAFYQNKEHTIKIVKELQDKKVEKYGGEYFSIKSSLYIDGKVIYNNGFDEELYETLPTLNIDAKTYIFDEKYLGLLVGRSGNSGTSYSLYVYNEYELVGNMNIIIEGQSLSKTSQSEKLNSLDKLEFDGHKFMFWGMSSCVMEDKSTDTSLETVKKYAIIIENDKIKLEIVDVIKNAFGAGTTC